MVLIDSRAFDEDYKFDWKTGRSKKNIYDEVEEDNMRTNKDGSLRIWIEITSDFVKY